MTFSPAKLQAAIERLESLPDAAARAAARDALTAILELHGEALQRMTSRIRSAGEDGKRILQGLLHDEMVASLFSIHGLDVPSSQLVPAERLVAQRREHERCELCGQALAPEHEHLYDVDRRKLTCACVACSVLFDGRAGQRRRVRSHARCLENFRISDSQWTALGVPVALAFFSRSSSLGQVIGMYPGPAGVAESAVPDAAWQDLVTSNPVLADLEPDTSALLVERLSRMPQYHILSIDHCYRLVGIVRSGWQGITGGQEPLRALQKFLDALPNGRS